MFYNSPTKLRIKTNYEEIAQKLQIFKPPVNPSQLGSVSPKKEKPSGKIFNSISFETITSANDSNSMPAMLHTNSIDTYTSNDPFINSKVSLESPTKDVVNESVGTVTKFAGRIRFEGVPILPSAPTDLICEECEKNYSVYYCEGCKQLFCLICADLCHPRLYENNFSHPHEKEELIRQVQIGDWSRIKPDNTFHLPNEDYFPEDYMMQKDLSKPGSLATNQPRNEMNDNTTQSQIKQILNIPEKENVLEQPSATENILNYFVNQIVLFPDEETHEESFGRIISEWDLRHGHVAPPLIRHSNDQSSLCYIIEMLGYVSNQPIGVLEELLMIEQQDRNRPSFELFPPSKSPQINTLDLDMDNYLSKAARRLNHRIAAIKNIQLLGPQYHLRYIQKKDTLSQPMNHLTNTTGNDHQLVNKSMSYHEDVNDIQSKASSQSMPSFPSSSSVNPSIDPRSTAIVKDEGYQMKFVPSYMREEYHAVEPIGRHPIEMKPIQSSSKNGNPTKVLNHPSSSSDAMEMIQRGRKMAADLIPIVHRVDQVNLINYPTSLQMLLDERGSKKPTSPAVDSILVKVQPPDLLVQSGSTVTKLQSGIIVRSNRKNHVNNNDPVPLYDHNVTAMVSVSRDGVVGGGGEYNPFAIRSHYLLNQSTASQSAANNPIIINNLQKERIQLKKDMTTTTTGIKTYVRRNIEGVTHPTRYEPSEATLIHSTNINHLHRINQYDQVDLNLYADIDTDDQSQLSLKNVNVTPVPAMFRSYEQLVEASNASAARRHTQPVMMDETRCYNIVIVNGKDLTPLSQRIDFIRHRKEYLLQSIVQKHIDRIEYDMIHYTFYLWRDKMEYLKLRQFHLCAILIQTIFRMWRCRNALDFKRAEIKDSQYKRWKELHDSFHHSLQPSSSKVTIDNKLYFETHADINRYSDYLLKMIHKLSHILNRKRIFILHASMMRWKSSVGEYLEETLVVNHFNGEAVDIDEHESDFNLQLYLENKNLLNSANSFSTLKESKKSHTKMTNKWKKTVQSDEEQQLKIKEIHQEFHRELLSKAKVITQRSSQSPPRSPGVLFRSVSSLSSPKPSMVRTFSVMDTNQAMVLPLASIENYDEFENKFGYDSIASLPLQLPPPDSTTKHVNDMMKMKSIQTDYNPPSYFPGKDIANLPPLPDIFHAKDANGRLILSNSFRMDSTRYRAKMEGPCDNSSWVIPTRVGMGGAPYGAANHDLKRSISAMSALLFAGFNCFISLLHDDEEEKRIQIENESEDSIAETIEIALIKAKQDMLDFITFQQELILKQRNIMEIIPSYGITDPRYPRANRERVRCLARIQLAEDNINHTKQQTKNLPTKTSWFRIPLPKNTAPTVDEILPSVWEIENQLRLGCNVYMYSGSGHGRCGMVSSIILGRLYQLHPYEAIYRIQASHDSARSEQKRSAVIHCPQLPIQRKLIYDVLTIANRPLESIQIRVQIDPETMVNQYTPRKVLHESRVLPAGSDVESKREMLRNRSIFEQLDSFENVGMVMEVDEFVNDNVKSQKKIIYSDAGLDRKPLSTEEIQGFKQRSLGYKELAHQYSALYKELSDGVLHKRNENLIAIMDEDIHEKESHSIRMQHFRDEGRSNSRVSIGRDDAVKRRDTLSEKNKKRYHSRIGRMHNSSSLSLDGSSDHVSDSASELSRSVRLDSQHYHVEKVPALDPAQKWQLPLQGLTLNSVSINQSFRPTKPIECPKLPLIRHPTKQPTK